MAMQEDDGRGVLTRLEFQKTYRIGHDKFYQEIKAGRLRAVKIGTKTIVLPQDRQAWEATLPAIKSR
jgi:hypothetical protein